MMKSLLLITSMALASGEVLITPADVPVTQVISPSPGSNVRQRDQGNRYRIGRIMVDGAKSFSPEQIIQISGLKTRSITKGETIERAAAQIKKAYARRGYIKAGVSISRDFKLISPGAKVGVVDLMIGVHEGPVFFVRFVEFVGNVKTRDKVIRRTLVITEGEPYNPDLIDESIRRLNKLGRFERITRDDVELRIDEQEHRVDIRIHVKEKDNPVQPLRP